MQHLLTHYHPTLAPLATSMRDALHASTPRTPLGQPIQTSPWRAVLARVSDESRPKFQENLDKDLDWLLAEPEAAWVKANVTDVEAFRNTPAGDLARSQIGMNALYAPGTKRLVGGWLARNGWLFLFLLSSAAKADLEQNRNAVTEAIIAALLAMAHDNPHDATGRPLLHAHALDRIVRSEPFAWAIFDTLTRTYVRVDAAGRPFDALSRNAKDEWTLITFGASRGRDDTASRFLVARLNKARAGNWPGNSIGLPRGYAPTAEPDPHGRFNLTADPKKLTVSRPTPDPRQRWEVQTIASASLDPAVTTWSALTIACGAAGLTARGADEKGKPLQDLLDPTLAGKLLITPTKIRAYLTGKLAHTETGVTPGQFSPGDGHKLEPRHPGDELGHVTYDINVGRPEDHGWDWGVPPAAWRDVLLKFWLPTDFTPKNWCWTDDPLKWGWDQILTAAEKPRPQATGMLAAKSNHRPFSGLMRWSDPTHRHLLYCIGTTNADLDRYEWRQEAHSQSRRNSHGTTYRIAASDGDAVCSWPVREFHQAWSGLAERLLTELIADHPDATIATAPVIAAHTTARTAAETDRHHAAKDATLIKLGDEVTARRADADVLLLSAAHKRASGDEDAASAYERQAANAQAAANDAAQRLEQERQRPLPAPTVREESEKADFGSAAAVLAALTGAYATGPAPKTLHTALQTLGAETTRLELVDSTTVRLSVTITVRRPNGTPVQATGHTLIRRSRPHTNTPEAKQHRQLAKEELARKWFREGIDLATLTNLAGTSEYHALRIVREQLATGTARTVGQARLDTLATDRIPSCGLRIAITAHPAPEARACLWADLNPNDPAPTEMPHGYPELIAATYRQSHDWSRRSVMLDPQADHRADAITILRALPDPTAPIRTDHLAALMGVSVRHPNGLSAPITRRKTAIPPSLVRIGQWGGPGSANLPASQRTVALIPCPWNDCPSPTADAILLLPETVIGAQASVVCRTCLRTATLNVKLPDTYKALLDPARPRTGTWVACTAPDCHTDLGAGAGTMWRWDDTPPTQPTTHPSCTPAGALQPTNAAIRQWAIGNGYAVQDRGRIPATVMAAYEASHPTGQPSD